MFAPAPRSHHISRTYGTYGHPTTSKKNTNKENANALPSKTPSRVGGAGKPVVGTSMRMGLGVKTEGRDRNVLAQQGGLGKGKGKEGEDIEPKRLFANAPPKAGSSIPPSKSLSSMPQIVARGPSQSNAHYTPAPSRRQPPSQPLRTPAPSYFAQQEQAAPTPLPSATRTRRKSRQSLSISGSISGFGGLGATPLKESRNEDGFKTPAPSGKWEEENSLESIEEHMEGLQIGVSEGVIPEEEDEEVEYMPPAVEEQPWTPAWDHPDIAEIYSSLSAIPALWTPDVVPIKAPELIVNYVDEHGLALRDEEELEHPLLRLVQPKIAPPAVAKPLSRPGGGGANRPINARAPAPVRPPIPHRAPVSARPLPLKLASGASAHPPLGLRTGTAPSARANAHAHGPARPGASSRVPSVRAVKPVTATIDKEDQALFDSWGIELELGDEVLLDIDLDSDSVNAVQE